MTIYQISTTTNLINTFGEEYLREIIIECNNSYSKTLIKYDIQNIPGQPFDNLFNMLKSYQTVCFKSGMMVFGYLYDFYIIIDGYRYEYSFPNSNNMSIEDGYLQSNTINGDKYLKLAEELYTFMTQFVLNVC